MSDELATLAQLLIDFATASLLAIGGGSAALPELHTVVVADTHWLSDQQFKEIYSLGQVAPGPNMTMVAVIGKHVAGWPGALVALIAFFLPSSLLAFGTNRLWRRLEPWPWLDAIQQGLAPVAIGLLFAGVWLLARLAARRRAHARDRGDRHRHPARLAREPALADRRRRLGKLAGLRLRTLSPRLRYGWAASRARCRLPLWSD